MFKLNAITRFVCAAAITLATVPASAEPTAPAAPRVASAVKSGRLAVNGVDYYYEVHGRGEPLLLLHGGLGSIDMFGTVLTKLAENRLVIAVDLQGHGRTALGKRPFRLESIGDDMATLVKRLGYPKVDVLGYSLGGGVAFRMALQKPASVRRLALVSTAFSDDGYYAELKALQVQVSGKAAPMMKDTPMYKSYAAVAPNVSDFPRLLENMSKNRLAILPDLTHYEIFASPRLATTVLPFLDGRSDVKSWAEQVTPAK